MPRALARRLAVCGVLGTVPAVLLLVVLVSRDGRTGEFRTPAERTVRLAATAVPTVDMPVRLARSGRVLSVEAQPGMPVQAGDPIAELEDLALAQSIRALRRQIGEIEAQPGNGAVPSRDEALRAEREVREAVVQQLQRAHALASEELERWTQMQAEGLVARLDFERKRREFGELEARLQAALQPQAVDRATVPESGESPQLARARRLLGRLEGLPRSFRAKSPWDGTVRKVRVQSGESPPRGAVIATVGRAAPARLEAALDPGTVVLAVKSACGVPGPLPFVRRPNMLSLACPAVSVRPGEGCALVLAIRE